MRAFARIVLPPLVRISEVGAAALLFIMMMLTFADVVGRYVFSAPIFGAAEIIQFLLAMSIFAGLCLVNARDEHITVELFEVQLDRMMPHTVRRIIIQTFSVGVMAVIAYQLYRYALDAEQLGTKTIVLEWPLAVVSFTVAGLSVVSLIMQVLGLVLARESHGAGDLGSSL
jgi:TRAP-type C4-dicarboxylate transport system permease small subunit